MRWVVTGAGGMLGADVVDVLRTCGQQVLALTRADLDVADGTACLRALGNADVVINAAAWTDVDGAEGDPAAAYAVNALGAANVARACTVHAATLVHMSTDYVFDGTSRTPYTVDAPLSPLSSYGRSKAAGEWAVRADCPSAYVVRTGWLYGQRGNNFIRTILRLAQERDTLPVVNDQRGQPTWTRDLAKYLRDLVLTGARRGIHHGTSTGEASWYDLARETLSAAGLDPARVTPTSSDAFPRRATRPAYSVLDNDGRLPEWRDALHRAIPHLVGGC